MLLIGTPYQNYWPQPMTYFIPQAQPTAAPPTPNNHMIQSVTTSAHNTSTNTTTTSHRRTSQLAQQQQQQHQNSALQSFPSSVPLPLATASQADPNTPTNTPQATMYALPPSMYPNVLPYAAPTSFYQTLPHPQPNAIISSVIPAHSAHPTANSNGIVTGNLHHTYTPTGNFQATEVLTHFPFNQQTLTHANNTHMNQSASTPQSAPSTPLSLTTVPPNFNKNPPLFATPPIITATGTSTGSYIQHHHDNSTNTYEKRNGNGFGGPKKYINNNNNNNNNNVVQMIHATTVTPTTTTVPPHATTKIGLNTRQNSYQMNGVTTVTSQGKTSFNNNNNNNYNSEDNNSSSLNNSSNNNSSNNYNSNRLKNNNNNNYQTTSQTISYQPKTFVPAAIKMQQQQSANNSGSNTNSSGNSPNSNETETKYQSAAAAVQPSRGPPRIPPSLDLKRNSNSNIINAHHHHHQQRSTPSTNSNESSNQSPNSITSYDHSRTYHYPQYQQATGPTSGHFYRGNSAGSTHHNSGNGGDSTPIPTCFPFNVHQNAGASTPMLDSCHHQLISAYNPMAAGMYVKWNGHSAFSFANVSICTYFLRFFLIFLCIQ